MAKKGLKFDVPLCISVLTLVGFGTVLIYSSSAPLALVKGLPESFYLTRHAEKVVVGLFVFLIGMLFPYRLWKRAATPLLVVSIGMLLYILLTGGTNLNGASRWVFGIQPSELAKLALIVFLAYRLAEKKDLMHTLGPGLIGSLLVPAFVMLLIILQPNYSMVLMLAGMTVVMVYAGGARLKHLLLLGTLAIPLLAVLMVSSAYRLQRVMAFLDPKANTASAHQSLQALISLGNGGLIGTGLGEGTQKLGYLPMPFTDTVFAILGEELGFFRTFAVMAVFAVVIWRGLRIARGCSDRFGSLLAVGICASIALNFIVHVGVCVKLFPTTGQPLPFVSYGGTALIINLLGMGILLNISSAAREPETHEPPLVWRSARRTTPLRPFVATGASRPETSTVHMAATRPMRSMGIEARAKRRHS
ncbi:MAG TPA: putative peptidoglycan glycosyltransferase FtsW [Fibrobacteria bacterium]|jgi:cell division protein FtsW|nr:putative peptidoglycan glycosyltransferase FtsW [Fibrobacteria bacterium]